MKKTIASIFCLICVLGLAACAQESPDVFYSGLNAEIIGIDRDGAILTVRSIDTSGPFAESCAIDFSHGAALSYCDFETGDMASIGLDDLLVGDQVTLYVYQSELDKSLNAPIQADVQLMTQRLNRIFQQKG